MAEGGTGYRCRFQPRKLSLPGRTLPPSIPLLVYTDYNCRTCTLQRKEQEHGSQQFYLPDDALELIRGIDKPVAVLSICGPYRTGKSYFLSRVVSEVVGNSTEIFQLGHTMDPFTQGIWMATTALECDEFVLLLLDTEGTDSADVMEATPTNVLIMSILLSSYLIYNSIGVPRKTDLHNMSCFAHLSTCILAEKGNEEDNIMNLQKHFPDFLWLLRDASLKPTDGQGRQITPTEYLKTRILIRSKEMQPTAGDHVVRAVLELFPSLECKTIAPPLVEDDILENITENEDQLSPRFNMQVKEVIWYILQHINTKQGFIGEPMNGPTLVSLAEQYRDSLNKQNVIPSLETSWMAVIEQKLKDTVTRLVHEYDQKMDAALEDKLPLEIGVAHKQHSLPQTLMGIHNSVWNPLYGALNDEINHLLPIQPDSADTTLTEVRNSIWTECDQLLTQMLYKFKDKNFTSSQTQCEKLFVELYQPIQEKMDTPGYSLAEFHCNVKRLKHDYFSQSIGPARHKVWWGKQCEVIGKIQESDFIPGPPLKFRVAGRAHDRIKVRWDPPDINAAATLCYSVEMKHKEDSWIEIASLPADKRSVVARSLESHSEYHFRLCAENGMGQSGVCSVELETKTKFNKATQYALTAMAGTVGAPFYVTYLNGQLIKDGIESHSATHLAAGAIGIGPSILHIPAFAITLPILGPATAAHAYHELHSDEDVDDD